MNSDPSVREVAQHLDGLLDEIESLRDQDRNRLEPNELILEQYQRELDADKQERAELLAKMQELDPRAPAGARPA